MSKIVYNMRNDKQSSSRQANGCGKGVCWEGHATLVTIKRHRVYVVVFAQTKNDIRKEYTPKQTNKTLTVHVRRCI